MKISLNSIVKFLWAAALVTLPVASFRWFPFLGDDTLVRPMALYPLALLLPLLLIQWIRGERPFAWTGSAILLAVFTVAVLTAASFGVLIDPLPMRGQTYSGRVLRALVTLVIGLVFFISSAWMNRDEDEVRFTLKWLLVGFCLDLAWSGVQAVTFYTHLLKKEMVTHWQLLFSMRELVKTNRVSGLAYEPAWLAGQIATTYLPVLFAAILTKTRITRLRWLEPVLLALAALLLLATYSRGGILIGLGAAVVTFLVFGRDLLRATWTWFFGGFRGSALHLALRLGMIAVLIGVMVGGVAFLSRKNYFRRLWESTATNLNQYLIDINAGARSAYAVGAMGAYDQHPILGVGLGASGFWIYNNLPDWTQTTVPEIARQLDPTSKLYPNPKDLYVRLLAETGLVGFALFLIFMLSSFGDALSLLRRGNFWYFLGIAGFFAWLAIALYNVTQDSFATPNIWVIPGILAGISSILSPLIPRPKDEGEEIS